MPLTVENKGISTRDFIYVEDICRGLIACALKGTPGDVYNIASGKEMSIMVLATIINKHTGNDGNIEFLPRRPWDHSIARFGSTKKSREQLGFEVQVSFEEGLARTIEWTKQNLEKIDVCIAKHKEYMTI
jgi:nucleoside-diphosphate-sugar epimerase